MLSLGSYVIIAVCTNVPISLALFTPMLPSPTPSPTPSSTPFPLPCSPQVCHVQFLFSPVPSYGSDLATCHLWFVFVPRRHPREEEVWTPRMEYQGIVLMSYLTSFLRLPLSCFFLALCFSNPSILIIFLILLISIYFSMSSVTVIVIVLN